MCRRTVHHLAMAMLGVVATVVNFSVLTGQSLSVIAQRVLYLFVETVSGHAGVVNRLLVLIIVHIHPVCQMLHSWTRMTILCDRGL